MLTMDDGFSPSRGRHGRRDHLIDAGGAAPVLTSMHQRCVVPVNHFVICLAIAVFCGVADAEVALVQSYDYLLPLHVPVAGGDLGADASLLWQSTGNTSLSVLTMAMTLELPSPLPADHTPWLGLGFAPSAACADLSSHLPLDLYLFSARTGLLTDAHAGGMPASRPVPDVTQDASNVFLSFSSGAGTVAIEFSRPVIATNVTEDNPVTWPSCLSWAYGVENATAMYPHSNDTLAHAVINLYQPVPTCTSCLLCPAGCNGGTCNLSSGTCTRCPVPFAGANCTDYAVPMLTAAHPASVTFDYADQPILIEGSSFRTDTIGFPICRFGATIVPSFAVSATSIYCIAPGVPAPSSVVLSVSNDGVAFANVTNQFQFTSAPACAPSCGLHGTCIEGNLCVCDTRWAGSRCDEMVPLLGQDDVLSPIEIVMYVAGSLLAGLVCGAFLYATIVMRRADGADDKPGLDDTTLGSSYDSGPQRELRLDQARLSWQGLKPNLSKERLITHGQRGSGGVAEPVQGRLANTLEMNRPAANTIDVMRLDAVRTTQAMQARQDQIETPFVSEEGSEARRAEQKQQQQQEEDEPRHGSPVRRRPTRRQQRATSRGEQD